MSFTYVRKIPAANEIIAELPLDAPLAAAKKARDAEIAAVFDRTDPRFLVIIGPCSADNEDAVCEYVSRLAGLQEKVREKLLLIPRIYTNKPRTTGEGYKGMVHQPDPTEAPNIVEGIRAIRRMHLRAFKESRLSAADEMLYPTNYPYLADLLSYVAIGARSVENQQHRLTVSGLDVPAGMKNPTSGDLTVMLNSVQAAQAGHTFIYDGWEVRTPGNPYAHCILRGSVNPYGQSIANYHYEDLERCAQLYLKRPLGKRTIVIDVNHANSNKQFAAQPRITLEVARSVNGSALLKDMVRGVMIESYLEEGAQDVSGGTCGRSITDPCLGWKESEKLVLDLAAAL